MVTDSMRELATAPAHRLRFWLVMVGVVTFLAGLLFGYDQGVISGAPPILEADLGLSDLASEIITSWVTLGALFGALVAGTLADRRGRRWTAIAAGILFILGAILEAVSPGAALLTLGRVITGLGVGFASTVAPLFAAEMAPKWLRGRFESTYQLAITVGILLGRRPLLLTGLVGMGVALLAVGVSFFTFSTDAASPTSTTVAGIVTLVALVVFIASFAFSLGPVVWTIVAEIFPNRARGRAVSLATAFNWGAAFLVTQFFLTIVDGIGESTTFILFAVICAVSWIYVWRRVPETRGRSLEEIQELWSQEATPAR